MLVGHRVQGGWAADAMPCDGTEAGFAASTTIACERRRDPGPVQDRRKRRPPGGAPRRSGRCALRLLAIAPTQGLVMIQPRVRRNRDAVTKLPHPLAEVDVVHGDGMAFVEPVEFFEEVRLDEQASARHRGYRTGVA